MAMTARGFRGDAQTLDRFRRPSTSLDLARARRAPRSRMLPLTEAWP